MWYLILIIILIWFISFLIKNTFYWETILKHLWKDIFIKSDSMAGWLHASKRINESQESYNNLVNSFKEKLSPTGKLINSIIDYINRGDSQKEDEKTFGFGRYDFDSILYLAETDENVFKKHLK